MILGIIPARKGSKGLLRKNTRMIAGKPLIAWTIEDALASKLLDRIVVTTDDAEAAKIAAGYGVEVLRRPKRLAGDRAPIIPVFQHVLAFVPADTIVVLQPTSPIRSAGLIDRCISRFRRSSCGSLATGFICKFRPYGKPPKRRQDIKGFFYDDGSVYVIRAALIRRNKLFSARRAQFCTSRPENIDIDEPFDFWLAKQALCQRQRTRKKK